jgi:probable F420-dependent oxidoreductase
MKFGLYGVGLGAMATSNSSRIAILAEELGYDSLWTGEHMALPSPKTSPSHRDPTHPFLDPLLALAYLSGRTTRILFGTGVLLLPQRHPVQLAKELASLDILSNGRLLVGFGVGYLESEMSAVGIDPRTRVGRAEEYLQAIRTLWCDESPSFQGEFVSFDGIDAYPRPMTVGGPPVILGGNSDAAIRRAARLGDGWYGYMVSVDRAKEAVKLIRSVAIRSGRDGDIEITVTPNRPLTAELILRYDEAGVHRLVAVAEGPTLDAVEAVVRKNAPYNL